MSSKFAKVRYYFDSGLWTIEQVRNAVVKGWITPEEFFEITDMEYREENANE